MMTKKELLKNLDNGYMEDVAKEINRYGEMTHDNSWIENEGFYKGNNRLSCYRYYGLNFTVEKLNGEVKSIGHSSTLKHV